MLPQCIWQEDGATQRAAWRSAALLPPPERLEVVDGSISAARALQLASGGTALLWRGDFPGALQLLQALQRRAAPQNKAPKAAKEPVDQPDSRSAAFHRYRMQQAQRARLLGRLLVPLDGSYRIPLRRAPEVSAACAAAWGPADGAPSLLALRELQGVIGAWEWQKKGVFIPALAASIHPHYGVFSPLRGEYIDLVASAPLPAGADLAFDIGSGSGVLAALLARRGVARVIATDCAPRAVACARANLANLGLAERVSVQTADLFPAGQAKLIVCNPPWLPGKASSPLEAAVYDPDSRMLQGFISGLAAHLAPGGEGWLIVSDLAERLGLRAPDAIATLCDKAGLRLLERHTTRPRHPKSSDRSDPLHAARAAEVTSLWRLQTA